jgi:NarL family two-component system response regulator LiaR
MNVAIIEDNTTFRNALVQLVNESDDLELFGSFPDAETALPYLQKDFPDVAIVDIQLPGISGIEFIGKIRIENSHTQFLICTIHDESDNIFEALKSGATGYILKDSSIQQILNAIKELAKGGAPMSPFIARKIISSFQKPQIEQNIAKLSDREVEVIKLVAKGLLYKEIANTLSISKETVKKHLKNIYQKLHVQNKIEALNKFGNY